MTRIPTLTLLCLAAVLAAARARAETAAVVERGSISIFAPVSGTVIPTEEIAVKAKRDGRIEALPAAPLTPFKKKDLLALESAPELAAIIDANATTQSDVVQKRWQDLYKPIKVKAPFDGFLLETKVGLKESVKADQPLFIVTQELIFEAVVALKDTPGMSAGRAAWLWRPSNPELKLPGRVREVLPGTPTPDQARVRIQLLPAEDVAMPLPGTLLDGEISIADHRNVIVVPSGAIRREEGRSFIYVEVKEGITDGANTEITDGLSPGRVILTPTTP